jgi:hypothetical protein
MLRLRYGRGVAVGLTIAGGVLQAFGLGFVFIELAVIRSHEFSVPTPWARLAGWVRRAMRRSKIVHLSALADSFSIASSVRMRVRPGPVDADATYADRIGRVERYVDCLDKDVDELHRTIEQEAENLSKAAQQRAEELRHEMEQREERRRHALRPSLQRQATGAVCVLVGLVLATVGGVV